jgi:hypothetical protein
LLQIGRNRSQEELQLLALLLILITLWRLFKYGHVAPKLLAPFKKDTGKQGANQFINSIPQRLIIRLHKPNDLSTRNPTAPGVGHRVCWGLGSV